MNDKTLEDALALLTQKYDAVERLWTLTEAETFPETPDDVAEFAGRYADLYEKREKIIAYIQKIDAGLTEEALYPALQSDAAKAVIDRIKATASRILALDKRNIETVQGYSEQFKSQLKTMRESRVISNLYTDDGGDAAAGYYLDSKK